jgi:voltage-gated potassium channel
MQLFRTEIGSDGKRSGGAVAGTASLVSLIFLLLGVANGYLALVMIASVVASVMAFHHFFRASRAFGFALANLIAIYACVFLFFVESNFERVGSASLAVGFLMPLAAFAAGSLRRRAEIHQVILSGRMRDERHFLQVLGWLLPVFAVGALTFFVPRGPDSGEAQHVSLLAAMALVSAVVFAGSREVALFLLDTGLLFEAFFRRVARLVIPAFAFLTCYSLLVICFASFYSLADYARAPNFRIDGVARALTFPETLYFSVTTLSTVGYGDISPVTNLVRFIVAIEIVCGILLLLFGFNEIFSFAQERRRQHKD